MGFWDIDHWVASDGASDFRWTLIQAFGVALMPEAERKTNVRKVVTKELADMANNYNTPGYLNLALCLEVEGKDKGYDEELPVFSHLLTTAQLRKADRLFTKEIPHWNPKHRPRLKQLHKVITTLIKQRGKVKP